MSKYDFFISYNQNDLKHAKRIATLIKNGGLNCWWQNEDSKQEYAEEIREAIKASAAFIVLLSQHSACSEWVGKEMLDAIRLHTCAGLKILPVVCEELERTDYDYFHHILGDFNWLFLKDYDSDKELIRAIANQVSMKLKGKSANSIYSAQAQIEQERLRKQNGLYNLYAQAPLNEIFQKLSCPSVLDVGSSDGENIISRLENREYSHLLCIDKERDKLDAAAEKLKNDPRAHFMHMDITRKSFLTGLKNYLQEQGMTGFDLIHISAVLLHLKNPLAVLKALHEVLSEGGCIFIQDEDDGYNREFEEDTDDPTFFSDCYYIWEHSKESGDRSMGRKIPVLLKHAGYENIQMPCTVISSVDYDGAYKEDLWDIYFNPKYWVVDSPDYFDKRDAFEKCVEYTKKHDKKKHKYMKDQIFLTLGVPIYIANK